MDQTPVKQHPLYRTWRGVRTRCTVPTDRLFARYGGRGIRVCPEWASSFATFVRDIGPKPSQAHSIERRDNNGHYEPGNCRWATAQEQANNRRDSRLVAYGGRIQTVAQWTRELGLSTTSLYARLNKGWTVERALTQPPR